MKPSAAREQQEGLLDRVFLVVGYGNTLRGDDGVGQRLAWAIEDEGWEGVKTIACHQLTPEVAETVSRAEAVVFVDAEVGGPAKSRIRRLEPGSSSRVLAHAADPGTILALSRDAFGRAPRAWLLTVPAFETGFGEKPSARALKEFPRALGMLRRLREAEAGTALRAVRITPVRPL